MKPSRLRLHSIDHLRALAAFMVLYWHYIHGLGISTAYVPEQPFMCLFKQGHIGVALFFVISGFIFTYLYWNKESINYKQFIKKRFLRIFPLLFLLVIFANTKKLLTPDDTKDLFMLLGPGVYGMWSIVVEFQFYLFFPALITFIKTNWPGKKVFIPLLGLIVLGYLFRLQGGAYQEMAYYSIFGRIDQLVMGSITALFVMNYQDSVFRRKYPYVEYLILLLSLFLLTFYLAWFTLNGGFYHFPKHYKHIWLFDPTILGLLFSGLVFSWYLIAENFSGKISRFFSYLGMISYSTYMIHFITIPLAKGGHFTFCNNLFISGSIACLVFMLPITYFFSMLLYEFIERPFLIKK